MTTSDYAQSAKTAATSAAAKAVETAKQAAAKVNLPFDLPKFDLSKFDLSKVDLSKVGLSKVDLANIDVSAMANTARDRVETVAKDVSTSVSHKVTLVREAVGI